MKSYDFIPCLSVAYLNGFFNETINNFASISDLLYHKKHWKEYLIKKIEEEKSALLLLFFLFINNSHKKHLLKSCQCLTDTNLLLLIRHEFPDTVL